MIEPIDDKFVGRRVNGMFENKNGYLWKCVYGEGGMADLRSTDDHKFNWDQDNGINYTYEFKADEEDFEAAKEQLKDTDVKVSAVVGFPLGMMSTEAKVLETKQEILAEVIAEAEKRLVSMEDAEYAKVVGGMLSRVDKSLGTEIIVSKKDAARLADVVKEQGFVLSEKTADINGGFIVKNGDIEYNYSFESIITVEKEAIRQAAAAILF